MDPKKIPFNKFVVNKFEYGKERFNVSVTKVPGGNSIKNESKLNRIKNARNTVLTNIKSPNRIFVL